jgi:ketosteroid isomerase-like protein
MEAEDRTMTQTEIQARNRKAVAAYFELHGPVRADLFAEQGIRFSPFSGDTTEVPGLQGRERIREDMARSAGVFTEWRFEELQLFTTQDPEAFWVDVKGRGKFSANGRTIEAYNKYVFFFRVRDGLIEEMHEYFNPLLAIKANGLSYEMPGWFAKAKE